MDLRVLPAGEFPIRFSTGLDRHGALAYGQPLHEAIKEALRLAPQVVPRYTSIQTMTPPGRLPSGPVFEGFARINGVRGVNTAGRKVAMISYSFFIVHAKALVTWSLDLTPDPPSTPTPHTRNQLWFHDGQQGVLLTEELRALVKSLVPKKTRRSG